MHLKEHMLNYYKLMEKLNFNEANQHIFSFLLFIQSIYSWRKYLWINILTGTLPVIEDKTVNQEIQEC